MDYQIRLLADTKDAQASIKSFAKTATAALGIFAAGGLFAKAISDSADFESAVNDVSIAFRNSGISGEAATQSIVDFAAAIQQTTKFTDDAVLSAAALIQNIARLDSESLKGATKAALDFSTALGIDVNTAAQLVGKAAEGNISAFARYGIEIRKGKTDAETFANTLKVLESRFGGSSEAATNTFAGSLAKLQNNLGDLLKEIGKTVTGSADVAEALNKASSFVISLINGFSKLAPSIKETISLIASLSRIISDNAVAAVSTLIGILVVLNQTAILGAIKGFISLTSFVIQYSVQQGIMNTLVATGVGALTALRAALAATGIGILIVAVGLLAQGFINLIDTFGSFKGALSAITLGIGKFFATVTGNKASVESYNKQLEDLKKSAIEAKKPIDDLSKSVKDVGLEKQRKELEVNIQAKIKAELVDKLSKDIDKLIVDLKNAGKDQIKIATETYTTTGKILKDSLKNQVIDAKTFRELSLKNELRFQTELKKAKEDAQKEEKRKLDEQLALAKQGSSSIGDFLKNFDEIGKKLGPKGQILSAIGGFAASIAEGAEGARKAVVGALTAGAEKLFGPAGAALGPLFDALSKGPEAIRALVKQFTDAIPLIIQNIILAIPELIIGIVDAIPQIIQGIIGSIPRIIDGLIAALPRLITSLALQMPRIATALASSMPGVAVKLATSLIGEAPKIVASIIEGIAKGIGGAVSGAGKGLVGGITGGITGGIKSIGKKFKFADGGIVPGGAPYTDRVSALLTPGEVVLNRDQVAEAQAEKISVLGAINNLAASISSGGSQNMTVNLVISEQKLAQVILNLNRQGFRTAI